MNSAWINPGPLADFLGLQGFLLFVGVEKDIKHGFPQEGLTHTGQIPFSDAHGAIQINGAGKGCKSSLLRGGAEPVVEFGGGGSREAGFGFAAGLQLLGSAAEIEQRGVAALCGHLAAQLLGG